ncbi:hypothetical protein V8E54_007877 [Elaphomyces granulatus]
MLDEDSDEEQNSDSLDDVSSDDDELFEPDNNSEFDDDDLDDNDLDEDNLDEAKIEALFAPTTRRVVEKLMIKRKWSLRHIILLYTRFGMATRRVRGLSHGLLRHKEISSDSILRYADPSSLAQFLAPPIRREWKRLVHNHDQPFSKARDSNPSGLLDVKHLFEYIRQAVLTSRLDQIQSLACCRYAHEVDIPFLTGRKFNVISGRSMLVRIIDSAPGSGTRQAEAPPSRSLQSMSQYTCTHPDRLCKHNPKLTELWIRCTEVPVVEHMEFVDCHKPDTLLDVGSRRTARNPPDIACSGPRRM